MTKVGWLLLASIVPALVHAERRRSCPPAEAEAIARKNAVPKLDLMCGSKLDVHYDESIRKASTDSVILPCNGAELCDAVLRWMFYACGKAQTRAQVAAAHLIRYECRAGGPSGSASVEVEGHALVATFAEHDADVRRGLAELETALHVKPSVSVDNVCVEDRKWSAFLGMPAAVATNESYCEVDGKKVPLPVTGDPLAPKTARVRCVSNGEILTDLEPGVGGQTGFSTTLEGEQTVFHTWKRGLLDGESWVRSQNVVRQRARYGSGVMQSNTTYGRTGGIVRHELVSGIGRSIVEMDEKGNVTRLECGKSPHEDAIINDYCGFLKPRKVTVQESFGLRTYTYDKGEITASE